MQAETRLLDAIDWHALRADAGAAGSPAITIARNRTRQRRKRRASMTHSTVFHPAEPVRLRPGQHREEKPDMPQTLVISFIANDRPGLVDRLSEVVSAHQGNWLESRMAHLAEKFAGVATVQVADGNADALRAALEGLSGSDFHLLVEGAQPVSAPAGPLLELDLVGPDQPGILHEISHCLAEAGVSVEEMETRVEDAPFAGGALFHATARLRLPDALDQDALAAALENLANALMVDLTLGENASDG